MGFEDILKKIDLLGIPPYFTFKGDKTYKSSFGAVLSVLAFLISIVSIYPNLEAWINQTGPSIQKETSKNSNPIPLATLSNKVFIMFSQISLLDFSQSRTLFIDDLEGLCPSLAFANITKSNPNVVTDIKLSKCTKEYTSDMDGDVFGRAFCIPEEISYQIFLHESTMKIPILTLDSGFNKFVNKDPLTLTLLVIWYQETVLNTQGGTAKLISRDWNQKKFLIAPNVMTAYTLEFSEEHILVNGVEKSRTYTVTDNQMMFSIPFVPQGSVPMVTVQLDYGKFTYLSNVKYTQITDVLSAFGGMIGLMLGIFRSVNQIIASSFMQLSMINEMFQFHYFRVPNCSDKSAHLEPNNTVINCCSSIAMMNAKGITNDDKSCLDKHVSNLVEQTKYAKVFKRVVPFTLVDLLKSIYSKKPGIHLEILKKASEIFNNSINYGSILKNEINCYILKSFIFDSEYLPFAITPSMNKYSDKSFELLSQICLSQQDEQFDNQSIFQKLRENIEYKPNSKLMELLTYSII